MAKTLGSPKHLGPVRLLLQLATISAALLACGGDETPAPRASPASAAASPAAASPPAPQARLPYWEATRPWWSREFGIGVVRYAAMYRYDAHDMIRASPSLAAETVAVLRRDSLCFGATPCVFSYGRMIEFDYEIPGWAILEFVNDSTWVRVSLAPSESAGPTGWVALGDSVRALLWSELLAAKAQFFLRPSDVAFYDAPNDSARVSRDLVTHPNSTDLNYSLRALEVQGRWMKVELLTPSPMCQFPVPTVVPDTLWIQYLTAEHRPRVFFYTRGC